MSKTIAELAVLHFGIFARSLVRDTSQASSPNVTHPVVTSLCGRVQTEAHHILEVAEPYNAFLSFPSARRE